MGTPGVPYKPIPKKRIVDTLKLKKGRLYPTAKALGITYATLRRQIDPDEDLVRLVAELRHSFDESLLDSAEDVLVYAMSQAKTDLTNAQKSTFFTLNNKGKARGYVPNTSRNQPEELTDGVIEAVQEINTSSRAVPTSRPDVAPEQPILDKEQPGTKSKVQTELGARSALDEYFSV